MGSIETRQTSNFEFLHTYISRFHTSTSTFRILLMKTLRTRFSLDVIPAAKKDKLRQQEKANRVKQLRAALPIFTQDEIRRIRIPYHEALICELDEQGYTSSGAFLRQLLQYQDNLRQVQGPTAAVNRGPPLIECRDDLDILYNRLKGAEVAHHIDNLEAECDEFLKLGVMYGPNAPEWWWWLGEQFLMQAVNCTVHLKDGGKKTAICKYIFGKFLLENLLDVEGAKEELLTARQLSVGKSWTPKKELGGKSDFRSNTVFVESCKRLYQCLMIEAKALTEEDPLKAARIYTIAKNRAADACFREGESEALMAQGICELAAGDASSAIKTLSEVLIYQKRHGFTKGICEAKIHIALAYFKIGRFEETKQHLEELLKFTTEQQFDYYKGQALRFLGEYYLNLSMPGAATPLLMDALQQFILIGDIVNSVLATNMGAISAGLVLMPKYLRLILKCGEPGEKGRENVSRLIKWKDTREMFWSAEEESCIHNTASDNSVESSLIVSLKDSSSPGEFQGQGEYLGEDEEIFELLETLKRDSISEDLGSVQDYL